ncbi:UNVERIFIED_CONTAM: hypothetical protein PYX00_003255 [Menopon gallinae]
MDAENTPEKRIRMSSSSSTESEKVLNKKPKEQHIGYDDDFTPSGRNLFGVQSDLFKDDDDEDVLKPQKITENVKPFVTPSLVASEEGHDDNSHDKENDSSLFTNAGNESESAVPVAKQRKLPNAFAKELTAKLSSVANKTAEEPKPKPRAVQNKEPSALFADYDDSDDLFSPKNSASNLLFKKQSIFSDGDADDQLFGDSDNLFSGDSKKSTAKNTVTAKESKPLDKSVKFADDDLFGSNDDFLFSGKPLLSSSHNSGGAGNMWKDSEDVKFSTPTDVRRNQEVPNADLFGDVGSSVSSNVANVSAITNHNDSSFNFSLYDDTSKDQGFVEPSDISINKSEKFESPGSFEPEFTSTRHMPSDTSDYKTHISASNLSSQVRSNSVNTQEDQRSKMGNAEKMHFSREQSDLNKMKGIFGEDDEDDDLFQTNKTPKTVKDNTLFDDIESDDLFSSVPPKENTKRPVFEEKSENILFPKSSVPPLEADEEDRSSSVDRLKHQDSVSMSSSRSSLFDDVNTGKTNLASVFDNEKSMKNSNDLFGDNDDNLFSENKTSGLDEPDDLFSDNVIVKSKQINKGNVKNLFDDLEDADDLFGDDVSKKLFQAGDDADLFGKPTKNESVSENSNLNNKIKSNASPSNEINSVGAISGSADNLFDDVFNETKKNVFEDGSKQKPPVVSMFGDLEDEDDDLFSNTKPAPKIATNEAIEKLEDDDLFKVVKSETTVNRSNEPEEEVGVGKLDEALNSLSLGDKEDDNGLFEEPDKLSRNNISNISSNESNDLFDTRTSKSHVLENKKLFESDDSSLFSKKVQENRLLNDKSEDGMRPSPPNTLNIAKRIHFESKQENSETDGTVNVEKPKVVGKLNIPANLKINPMSLLPGAVAKKNIPAEASSPPEEPKKVEKEVSFDTEVPTNLLKCVNKDRVKIQMRRRPQTRRARHEALRTSGIDFQAGVPEVSPSRSRSVDDFESEGTVSPTIKSSSDTNVSEAMLVNSVDEPDSKTGDSSSSIFHSVENSPEQLFSSPLVSNPLSPSTDEEDYFNVPELDVNFEREDQSIFKSNLKDDKADDKSDDTLLFDGAPVLSPMDPPKSLVPERDDAKTTLKTSAGSAIGKILKNRIVDDEDEDEMDDDDSLFKTAEPKTVTFVERKEEVKSRTNNLFDDLDDGDSFLFQKPADPVSKKEVPKKKSLFEDTDEDDDLFSEKSVPTSSLGMLNHSTAKPKLNKSAAEKPKQSFVDPLGLMANPD